jgi:hypothetical protein
MRLEKRHEGGKYKGKWLLRFYHAGSVLLPRCIYGQILALLLLLLSLLHPVKGQRVWIDSSDLGKVQGLMRAHTVWQ